MKTHVRVYPGDIGIDNDGELLTPHTERTFVESEILAVYAPIHSASGSLLVDAYKGCTLDYQTWLDQEIARGRVKMFVRKWKREEDISDTSIIMLGGKKYELTEVEE